MQRLDRPIIYGTILATVAAAMLVIAAPLMAQENQRTNNAPWQTADALHEALFNAQHALLAADKDQQAAALETLVDAQALAQEQFAGFSPDVQAHLQTGFADAIAAVAAGDTVALAAARGSLTGAIYWGAYEQVRQAVYAGDAQTAQDWLLVRDFRPSTRFSRPNVEATLAVQQMGQLETETVMAQVNADLLDTYQSRLTSLLNSVADTGLIDSRRAEAAATSSAYWQILAPAYEQQLADRHVQAAACTSQPSGCDPAALFVDLEAAVLAGDEAEIGRLYAGADALLRSFRAAPLSAAEQARRAGQLLRYLSLVPVEYGRGVTENVVTQDFEIQEAITFMDGAQAAFADLQLALETNDAGQAAAVSAQMNAVAANLRSANRQENVVPATQMEADVAAINEALTTLFPVEWLEQNSDADFDVLTSVLDQMEAAVRAGDYKLAESSRLEAYAIFDFGPEPRLLAYAPQLVAQIDGLFWQGYGEQAGLAHALALQAPPEEIAAIRAELAGALVEAQRTLGDLPSSPTAIATNAAIIVFREGLESVVILAALMASMVGAYRRFRRPMVVGVFLALAATALTWWLAQVVLTSLSRYGEKLEAVVSLIAIGILLLITNWFFHKTYWTDWMKGFHQQKRRLLSAETGQILGLVILGFSSMYREGFETVLFLQALVLDAGTTTVLEGVALGSVAVFIVGLIAFRVQQRLPYKKMLVYTGVLIGIVLLTMVGKTVHVLQAVGWIGISPVQGLTFPYWAGLWFGLYATWQGLALQGAAAVFVIGSFYGAEYLQSRKRKQMGKRPAVQAADAPAAVQPLPEAQQ